MSTIPTPNAIFALFLENFVGTKYLFKKTNFGYRTFNNEFTYYTDQNIINHRRKVREYNGYDYDVCMEEIKYKIEVSINQISVFLVSKKIS